MRKFPDFGMFVQPDGMEPAEAEQIERVLAAARAMLSLAAWIALSVAPVALPLQPVRINFLVLIYVVYSLYPLIFPSWIKQAARQSLTIYAIDVAWIVLLTTLTKGQNSPLFVLLIFLLVSAAYRWSFRETAVTAVPLGMICLWHARNDLNGFLWPAAYLLVGAALGYLIQAQKRLRRETLLAERARIARELHDGVVQSLTGLALHFGAARNENAADLIRHEIQRLRELIDQLTSAELGASELIPFLVEFVEKFGRQTGISANLVLERKDATLPPRVCREMAGIVREALSNVRKHSGARNVQVRFSYDDEACTLVIEDDGRGFDFSGKLSLAELDSINKGPRTIKERVRLLQGQLTIESTPGSGSRLTVTGSMKL